MGKYMKPKVLREIPSWYMIHSSVKLISYFMDAIQDKDDRMKLIKSFTGFSNG